MTPIEDEGPLSRTVSSFVARCLGSIEELEVLMLLRRGRDRYWSAAAVAVEVDLPPPAARAALEALASRNMLDIRIAQDVVYRFNPTEAETVQGIEATAEAYSRARVAVIRLFVERPRDPVRDFADAFRVKKKDEGG